MSGTYILRKGVAKVQDLKDGYGMQLPPGAGNVYYVMQTTNALYAAFENERQGEYADGTAIVHNTIQAGIDACTSNRNDYVIVMPDPSDYDISAVITIAKHRIHIIGAGGITGSGIPANSVRVHPHSTATDVFQITVSNAANVEIAGFFLKCAADKIGINLGTVTTWHTNIHDNFVGVATSAGSGSGGIAGTGASNHCVIHKNYINGYSPASTKEVDAFIALGGSSTRYLVEDNILMGGSGMTIAAGITGGGVDGIIRRNVINEGASALGAVAATFTVGIAANFNSLVYDNMFMMSSQGNAVTGGTTNQTRVDNREGTSGGAVVESA